MKKDESFEFSDKTVDYGTSEITDETQDTIPGSSNPSRGKSVAFGVSLVADSEIDQSYGGIHRRTSTAAGSVPAFDSISGSGLSSHHHLTGSIPPAIPESLPTTPGYELNGNSYFDIASAKSVLNPVPPTQQSESPSHNHPLQGMTLDFPPRNKWRLIAVVTWAITAGLSDAAPGALLPTIEKYYNISYSVVSLIWLFNAAGFIIIALVSHTLEPRLGKRKMTAGGCVMLVVMYAFVSPGSKFALTVAGFFMGGLGLALCLSQQNIFLSRFQKSSKYLGYFHGSYGLGACVGPLIATAIINTGVKWHYYYLILLGLSACNFFNLWFAFAGADEDLKPWDNYEPSAVQNGSRADSGQNSAGTTPEHEEDKQLTMVGETLAFTESLRSHQQTLAETSDAHNGLLKAALKNSRTWLLAFFVLFYQGAEVAMGGWIVTFLEDYRGGDTSKMGYVSSGFWGGLTLGRILLTTPSHAVLGAKRGVAVYITLSILATILTWVIPHIIAEAVFVSLAGMFIGPIYPLMVTIAVRILPRKIQVISLTIITAFGSSGGALFPFLVGLISQFQGAYVCMPVIIALLAATLFIWFTLPNPDRAVVNHFWQKAW